MKCPVPVHPQGTDVRWNGLLAAVFYGVTSVTMAFVNKAVLSSYSFNYPFFLLSCQLMMTLLFLEILCRLRWIELPFYTLKDGYGFMWPSLFQGMHGVLSLYALHGLNIPMYGALKRCSPLVTLVLSVVILKKAKPSKLLVSSIFIITIGCFIAAKGDITFDPTAYLLGLLSTVAQGLYLILVQFHAEASNMSATRILQLNSFNTLPPFIIMSILVGEPAGVVSSMYWHDTLFLVAFLTQIILGSLFVYSLFLCTTMTSALTTSLVGVAKSAFQTVAGFFAFGGVAFHPLNILGICMNTAGGFLYVYAKHFEKKTEPSLPQTIKDEMAVSNHKLLLDDESVKPIPQNGYLTSVRTT